LQSALATGKFYGVVQYAGAPPGEEPVTTDNRTCDPDKHCVAFNCYKQ